MQPKGAATRSFQLFAWCVLLYHVAVIVWGAFVRATGSGAGCGEHWPLCNGVVLPPSPTLHTIIEFTHRVTSGLALFLCLALIVFAFRIFPKGHLARRASLVALFFEFMEGLLGAALVLLGQVATDKSTARGFTLSIHHVNTLLLVAAFTVVVWAGSRGGIAFRPGLRGLRTAFLAAAAALLLVAVSGTIAALGDTLFQSASLAEGWRQDFARGAHPFVRLRVWHPFLAILVGLGLAALAAFVIRHKISPKAVQSAYLVIVLVAAQWGIGMINLVLLAPVALQVVHLAAADAVWIAFVLLWADVLLEPRAFLPVASQHPELLARTR